MLKNNGKAKIVLKIYRNLHKTDEVRETKIEVNLHQDKVDFINDAYEKGLQYWKRAPLESVSTEYEARELIESAPRKVILVRKAKNQKFVNIE